MSPRVEWLPSGEGFVPWPAEVAERYRREGLWTGETFPDLLGRWASTYGERPALVEGERRLTYMELRDRVEALAGRLAALGLRGGPQGDNVLVQLPNEIELVVTVLACMRLGLPPVLALPPHRKHELAYLAEHATVKAIFVPDVYRDFDHQQLAAEIAAEVDTVEHVFVSGLDVREPHLDLRALIEAPDAPPAPPPAATGADIAVLLLSGGTTGQPKLIARTHDDYRLYCEKCVEALEWSADTVYLASLPVAHNFALGGAGVLGALSVGGRAVLLATPSPAASFAAIEREGVTDVAAVPAVAQRWMDEVERGTEADLSSLRALQVGGARISTDAALRVERVLDASLQQVYGMAEGYVAYTRPGDPVEVWSRTQGRSISPGDELRVVDDDDVELAVGDIGHLLARGPYTIRGYYRAAEHNRDAFTADGWYRSGDIGLVDAAGNVVVEGRAKDQINRGGEKIACQELEEVMELLDGVARAAVVGYPDEQLGERVGAAVVAVDSPPSIDELHAGLAERGVAKFKFPERVIVIESLPLTKVQKIDKRALRDILAEAIPTEEAS